VATDMPVDLEISKLIHNLRHLRHNSNARRESNRFGRNELNIKGKP